MLEDVRGQTAAHVACKPDVRGFHEQRTAGDQQWLQCWDTVLKHICSSSSRPGGTRGPRSSMWLPIRRNFRGFQDAMKPELLDEMSGPVVPGTSVWTQLYFNLMVVAARNFMVQPPSTVGLGPCSAPTRDVSKDSLFVVWVLSSLKTWSIRYVDHVERVLQKSCCKEERDRATVNEEKGDISYGEVEVVVKRVAAILPLRGSVGEEVFACSSDVLMWMLVLVSRWSHLLPHHFLLRAPHILRISVPLLHVASFQRKIIPDEVHDTIRGVVEIEYSFICEVLSCEIICMNSFMLVKYIEFVADRLLAVLPPLAFVEAFHSDMYMVWKVMGRRCRWYSLACSCVVCWRVSSCRTCCRLHHGDYVRDEVRRLSTARRVEGAWRGAHFDHDLLWKEHHERRLCCCHFLAPTV